MEDGTEVVAVGMVEDVRVMIAAVIASVALMMLFASAIWSMLREPTVANLVVGIIGVLFMAPGAGYLLVRLFAGKGESSGSLAQSPS